ncbi:MAG: hypothetical protein V3V20_11665 [Algisphaera sp.]
MPTTPSIVRLAAAACLIAPALTASAGSINLDHATTGAYAGPFTNADFLETQASARMEDPSFVSEHLADDANMALASDGGVHILDANPLGMSISNIDARTISAERIDISGTSRHHGDGSDTLHTVAFDIQSTGGTFSVKSHDPNGSFDMAMIKSLKIYDATGAEVAFDNVATPDAYGLPTISTTLAAGNYTAMLSADASAAVGDDHFAFSATTAPSPSAVAAGLLGLIGLAGRRRRNA